MLDIKNTHKHRSEIAHLIFSSVFWIDTQVSRLSQFSLWDSQRLRLKTWDYPALSSRNSTHELLAYLSHYKLGEAKGGDESSTRPTHLKALQDIFILKLRSFIASSNSRKGSKNFKIRFWKSRCFNPTTKKFGFSKRTEKCGLKTPSTFMWRSLSEEK